MDIDNIGFYYMVYQPYPNKEKVRSWIDGDSSYRTYKYKDLMKLVPVNIQPLMRKSLMDYSMFLWDVKAGTIRRLTYKGEKIPIGFFIKDKKNVNIEEKEESIHENYWNADFHDAGLIVKK